MIHPLFAVLPASIDDPAAPSGGNRYDREVLRRLTAASPENPATVRSSRSAPRKRPAPAPLRVNGAPLPPPDPSPSAGHGAAPFGVREILAAGSWPRPAEPDRQALAAILGDLPDGALVLLDGLIACGVPELLEPHASRLRAVVLVHLPLSDETGLSAGEAAALRARESRTLRLAAAVIATSTPAARRVAQMHGLTGVHVVAPGVDEAPLAAASRTGARLLNVASLTHRKGQDILLDALAGLDDLEWACTIVGAGHLPRLGVAPPATLHHGPAGWQEPAPASPQRRIPPAGTAVGASQQPEPDAGREGTGRWVRLTGPLGGAALDEAYANADLLVLPSRAETYGMVVTEALARGLPVVAADVGGVPEALGTAPGGRLPGRLLPPDDPQALAAALREWLTDPALRDRWRARARSRRATLTGWDETARRLAGVLHGIA